MNTNSESKSLTEAPQNQPVNEPRTEPMEISHLAQMRAAQQASAPAAKAPEAGGSTPGGQQAPSQEQPERSPYIPRERFDQVNDRLRQAEAELAMLRQTPPPTGMQAVGVPVPPQQQPMTVGGMVQPMHPAYASPQAQGQAIANSPQVKGLLDQLADKKTQDEWRQKIANSPVTGLAEFIQFAIQTEGAALLQQALAPIQAQIAPLQQTFIAQQVDSYSTQRESDPTWHQVAPVFRQLAYQAAQSGYALNPQTLSVVEAVARQNVGLPVFAAPQPQQPAPFTERPGSGGQNFGTTQTPELSAQEKAMAARFGMTEQEYAAQLAAIRGGQPR